MMARRRLGLGQVPPNPNASSRRKVMSKLRQSHTSPVRQQTSKQQTKMSALPENQHPPYLPPIISLDGNNNLTQNIEKRIWVSGDTSYIYEDGKYWKFPSTVSYKDYPRINVKQAKNVIGHDNFHKSYEKQQKGLYIQDLKHNIGYDNINEYNIFFHNPRWKHPSSNISNLTPQQLQQMENAKKVIKYDDVYYWRYKNKWVSSTQIPVSKSDDIAKIRVIKRK